MRVAATQPNFLPWIGYYDLLQSVDVFIILDCVQLVRRSFMTRNRVFNAKDEVYWISESVNNCPQKTNMDQAYMDDDRAWVDGILNKLQASYRTFVGFKGFHQRLSEILPPHQGETAAQYNWRTLKDVGEHLGVRMPGVVVLASEIVGDTEYESPEDRIFDLCKKMNATEFFNFKKGVEIGLYSSKRFKEQSIRLFKQEYEHPVYDQYRSVPFVSHLSVIDLGFCMTDGASRFIASGARWEEA